MNFYFRTNINHKIGIGHYMRCSRLAKFFSTKGHKCFIYIDRDSTKLNYSKTFSMYEGNEKFINQKKRCRNF